MKGDNSRETFRKDRHYSAVRQQQGRVQVDADWNEQVAIQQHRDTSEATDVIGPFGVPEDNAGFGIRYASEGFGFHGCIDFAISAGRLYIDGILCECESETGYCTQPHLPSPPYSVATTVPDPYGGGQTRCLVTEDLPGDGAIYIDVWQRHVSWVEDDSIREMALGGPDTATRVQTVWQVKITPWPGDQRRCADAFRPVRTGRLAAQVATDSPQNDLCSLAPTTGYRGLENQLYRVEIHDATSTGQPSYKWSRDNGSVIARWLEPTSEADTLHVEVAGGSVSERFSPGDWVELTGDARELAGLPGLFVKLTDVNGDLLKYDHTDPSSLIAPVIDGFTSLNRDDYGNNPKIRRWDCNGPQPIVAVGPNDPWPELEEGIQVLFCSELEANTPGEYQTGDYWLIPARTANHDIEWPKNGSVPSCEPPLGIEHHIGILAEFSQIEDFGLVVTDRRPLFPSITERNPMPGQYRCYLVDPETGDDATAVVGIAYTAQGAVAGACHQFKSLEGVAARLPRYGNDSTAMILIGPGDYQELNLQSIGGYRKVIVRGCHDDWHYGGLNAPHEKQVCGGVAVQGFTIRSTLGGGHLGRDIHALIVEADDPNFVPNGVAWRGARMYVDREADDGWSTVLMVDEIDYVNEGADIAIYTNEFFSSDSEPQVGDHFVVELQGAKVQSIRISGSTNDFPVIDHQLTPLSNPLDLDPRVGMPITIAGVRAGFLAASGPLAVELSYTFVEAMDISKGLLGLSSGQTYWDEDFVETLTSVGLAATGLWIYHARRVGLWYSLVAEEWLTLDCDDVALFNCTVRPANPLVGSSRFDFIGGACNGFTFVTPTHARIDKCIALEDAPSVSDLAQFYGPEGFPGYPLQYDASSSTIRITNALSAYPGYAPEWALVRLFPSIGEVLPPSNVEILFDTGLVSSDARVAVISADNIPYTREQLLATDVRDACNNHAQVYGNTFVGDGVSLADVTAAVDDSSETFIPRYKVVRLVSTQEPLRAIPPARVETTKAAMKKDNRSKKAKAQHEAPAKIAQAVQATVAAKRGTEPPAAVAKAPALPSSIGSKRPAPKGGVATEAAIRKALEALYAAQIKAAKVVRGNNPRKQVVARLATAAPLVGARAVGKSGAKAAVPATAPSGRLTTRFVTSVADAKAATAASWARRRQSFAPALASPKPQAVSVPSATIKHTTSDLTNAEGAIGVLQADLLDLFNPVTARIVCCGCTVVELAPRADNTLYTPGMILGLADGGMVQEAFGSATSGAGVRVGVLLVPYVQSQTIPGYPFNGGTTTPIYGIMKLDMLDF